MQLGFSFRRIRFWQMLALGGLLFVAGLAVPTLTTAQSDEQQETYRQLGLFGDVFQRIRESYVDEVEDKELVEAAITGMLTSLDPHSSYLDTENYSKIVVEHPRIAIKLVTKIASIIHNRGDNMRPTNHDVRRGSPRHLHVVALR